MKIAMTTSMRPAAPDPSRTYRRIGTLKSVDAFREYLAESGIPLEVDDTALAAADQSPLAEPIQVGSFTVGNRWAIHPMEGWDGTEDGQPTEHTLRRWQHFGESGAKLIWGCEAYAVIPEGRANPNQLYYRPENEASLRQLQQTVINAHRQSFGSNADADLFVGLQLTHSGRFSRPNPDKQLRPRIAYHHPLLDERCGIDVSDDSVVLTDDEIKRLIDAYIQAAKAAAQAGFQFVDVKHCHGYLGHEFLSAFTRPGPYGGDFAGRTRFLREICEGIRAEVPEMMLGVRLSFFDSFPFHPDEKTATARKRGIGVADHYSSTDYPGFGCQRDNPFEPNLEEPVRLLKLMRDELGVQLVNLSAGSPYYNPHIQRPAWYPPSDGYQPPEDPLLGCVRQIALVSEVKKQVPDLPIVGTAYSYFQEYLPHVVQPLVRNGHVDIVGLGRVVLSQWRLPADVMEGQDLASSKKLCRTFSDCTTAPRKGLISGCFPLDDYYKSMPAFDELKKIKRDL